MINLVNICALFRLARQVSNLPNASWRQGEFCLVPKLCLKVSRIENTHFAGEFSPNVRRCQCGRRKFSGFAESGQSKFETPSSSASQERDFLLGVTTRSRASQRRRS